MMLDQAGPPASPSSVFEVRQLLKPCLAKDLAKFATSCFEVGGAGQFDLKPGEMEQAPFEYIQGAKTVKLDEDRWTYLCGLYGDETVQAASVTAATLRSAVIDALQTNGVSGSTVYVVGVL